MAEVDVPDESVEVVRESVDREKEIVRRRIERYEEKLESFESEHGMSSEEFLEKFESGKLGDDQEWFEWKAAFQTLKRLEDRLERLEKADLE